MFKTAFLETSALNGENIQKAFEELIEQIYQSNKEAFEQINKKIDKGVNLNEDKDNDNNNKKCCLSS